MANTTRLVPRLDDKTVLDIVFGIIEKFPPQGSHLNTTGLDQIDLRAAGRTNPLIVQLDKPGSYLITNASLNFENFNIHYYRSGTDQNHPRPYNDEFRIDHNNNVGGLEPSKRNGNINFSQRKGFLNADVGIATGGRVNIRAGYRGNLSIHCSQA